MSEHRVVMMIRPFFTGSAYQEWQGDNCDECPFYREDVTLTCPIDRHLLAAYIDEGLMSQVVAEKAGWTEAGGMPDECKKRLASATRRHDKQNEADLARWRCWTGRLE